MALSNDKSKQRSIKDPKAVKPLIGRTVFVGPKGGQYYKNAQGKKIYVPKKEW